MPSPPGLTCRPPHLGDKPRIARISAAEADAKGKSRNGEDDGAIQALVRWKTVESLKIYGRFNPLDYAARVRRMVNTRVDSTIAARLPLLSDDDLHRAIMEAMPAINSGRDVSEVCPDDETDNEGDDASPAAADAGAAAVESRGVARAAVQQLPAPRKRSRAPPSLIQIKFQPPLFARNGEIFAISWSLSARSRRM